MINSAHLQMMMCRSYACIVPSSGPGSISPQSQPPQGCLGVGAAGVGVAVAPLSGLAAPWLLEVSGTLSSEPATGIVSHDPLLLLLLLLYARAQRNALAPRATQMLALARALCFELMENWPLISRASKVPCADTARKALLLGRMWGASRL